MHSLGLFGHIWPPWQLVAGALHTFRRGRASHMHMGLAAPPRTSTSEPKCKMLFQLRASLGRTSGGREGRTVGRGASGAGKGKKRGNHSIPVSSEQTAGQQIQDGEEEGEACFQKATGRMLQGDQRKMLKGDAT